MDVRQLERQAWAALRAAAWTALLWGGYGVQRWLCSLGLPYDCDAAPAANVFRTLTLLALAGGAAGWLAGVTTAQRFAWLASRRQAYLWLIYTAMLPAYSAVSNVPALRASLSSVGSWGAGMAAVAALGAAAAATALSWHLWHAFQAGAASYEVPVCTGTSAASSVGTLQELSPMGPALEGSSADRVSVDGGSHRPPLHQLSGGSLPSPEADVEGSLLSLPVASAGRSSIAKRTNRRRRRRLAGWRSLALFLLPRLPLLLGFAAWATALQASGAFTLHLHHYALGWALAIFGAFNQPVSGLTLAVGAAILVQVGLSWGSWQEGWAPPCRAGAGSAPAWSRLHRNDYHRSC